MDARALEKRIPFRQVYQHLHPQNPIRGTMVLCPLHGDTSPSLEIKQDHGLCYGSCRTGDKPKRISIFDLWMDAHGCDFDQAKDEISAWAGLDTNSNGANRAAPHQPPPEAKKKRTSFKNLDAALKKYKPLSVYRYEYADGSLNYAELKVKTGERKKALYPIHEESGTWFLDLQGVKRSLYRLPELISSDPNEWVLYTEGAKDCDCARSLGFVAVTSGSSGSLKRAHEDGALEPLRGRRVALFADRDDAGQKMEKAAREILPGIVQELRICTLPNSEEIKGYDLSDYVADVGEDEATQLIHELIEETKQEQRRKPAIPGLISFQELAALDIPAPTMVVHGLIAEGVTVLAGPPKTGKSWFAMQLSLAVASGQPFLGNFGVRRGAVLHVGLEDNRGRFQHRINRQLGESPVPSDASFTHTFPRISLNKTKDPDALSLIHEWIDYYGDASRLVVLDTLAKIRPRKTRGNGDAYAEDYAALEGLQRLASSYPVSVVVCHHLNKTQGHTDQYDRVSGTSGITGAVDSVMILTRPRGATEGNILTSGRDIEEVNGVVSFDKDSCLWTWEGEAQEIKTSEEREEILAVMETTGTPMRPKDIHERLAGRRSLGSIQKSMTRMKDKGQLESSAKGRGWYVLPPNEITLQ